MRKGKMISQGAHAVLKIFTDRITDTGFLETTVEMDEWLKTDYTKIALAVNSEEELLTLQKIAEEQNIPNALIKDLGKTEFNGVETYTALAIGPAQIDIIDGISGHLKLL
jgi:peptidyl-tRNA hydrolase